MKPFRFRLQALVPLRKRAEEEALQAYARALQARGRAAEAFQAAQVVFDTARSDLQSRAENGLAASELRQLSEFTALLAVRRNKRNAELAECASRAESALRKMLWARQRREVLDKLKRRRQAEHGRNAARTEQKIIDERAQRPAAASAGASLLETLC
jgi:flagellar FliJ protein